MPIINAYGTPHEKFHYERWHFCLKAFGKELLQIKDKQTQALLKKYSVAVPKGFGFALLFPKEFKQSKLPKPLRLENEPLYPTEYHQQYVADIHNLGINDPGQSVRFMDYLEGRVNP